MWNGNLTQALSFVSNAGISYPLLRNAGAVTNLYAGGYEYVYVVGGDGRVTYRNLSGWNDGEVSAAVQEALDDLERTATPPATDRTLRLAPPHPNPFNPRTTLTLDLPVDGAWVSLEVFDQRGRRVRTLLDGEWGAGLRRVVFDGRDDRGGELTSGTYLFRLRAGDRTSTVKGALIR